MSRRLAAAAVVVAAAAVAVVEEVPTAIFESSEEVAVASVAAAEVVALVAHLPTAAMVVVAAATADPLPLPATAVATAAVTVAVTATPAVPVASRPGGKHHLPNQCATFSYDMFSFPLGTSSQASLLSVHTIIRHLVHLHFPDNYARNDRVDPDIVPGLSRVGMLRSSHQSQSSERLH